MKVKFWFRGHLFFGILSFNKPIMNSTIEITVEQFLLEAFEAEDKENYLRELTEAKKWTEMFELFSLNDEIPPVHENLKLNEDYSIVEINNVFEIFKGNRKLKQTLTPDGYLSVRINNNSYRMHRLLMNQFRDMPIDSKLVVDHIDGNRTNNSLNNLRVVPTKVNNFNKHSRGNKRYEYLEKSIVEPLMNTSIFKCTREGEIISDQLFYFKDKQCFLFETDCQYKILYPILYRGKLNINFNTHKYHKINVESIDNYIEHHKELIENGKPIIDYRNPNWREINAQPKIEIQK